MLLCLCSQAVSLQSAELFQDRYQDDAHEDGGEAAVVQAEATVQTGHQGDQAVVDHSGHKAVCPAVLIAAGAEAVGVAQTDDDGLGIDSQGEVSARAADSQPVTVDATT